MPKFNRAYFNSKFYSCREDFWHYFDSEYESKKYQRQIGLAKDLAGSIPIKRLLELGCAEGAFTKRLAEEWPDAGIDAVDISDIAVGRALELMGGYGERVRISDDDYFRYVSGLDKEVYDGVFLSESLYYLGSDHSWVEVCDFLEKLAHSVKVGGFLVMAHIVNASPKTQRFIMDGYRAVISGLMQPVYMKEYRAFKKEDDESYTYQIWGFKKGQNIGLSGKAAG
ncbi:MAG: class I SAM-dependent methyltransferase [Candidatus Aenigmarchaeota archaeon]|nr:class I SAM-dependent methyltransferase [Candidatus Aenigmarchaeota archaeon]